MEAPVWHDRSQGRIVLKRINTRIMRQRKGSPPDRSRAGPYRSRRMTRKESGVNPDLLEGSREKAYSQPRLGKRISINLLPGRGTETLGDLPKRNLGEGDRAGCRDIGHQRPIAENCWEGGRLGRASMVGTSITCREGERTATLSSLTEGGGCEGA